MTGDLPTVPQVDGLLALAPAPRAVDVPRLTSQLLAVALAVSLVPAGLRWVADRSAIPLWWDLAASVGPLVALGLAVRTRERAASRVLWASVVLAELSLPLVVPASAVDQLWLTSLAPVAAVAAVLLSGRSLWRGLALAVLVASTVVVQASGPTALDPRTTLVDVLFVVALFTLTLSLRRTFDLAVERLGDVRTAAVEEFVSARSVESLAQESQARDAYIHDEVIAALTVVAEGPAEESRRQALRVVEGIRHFDHRVPVPWIGSGSLDSVLRLRPDAETVIDVPPEMESVPDDVRRAVLEASSEALRNLDRHAYGPGGAGPARVEVRLDEAGVLVVVTDRGCGFDPRTVDLSRMGITVSIQARMDAVGGWSRVDSAPGRGTRVEIGWLRGSRPGSAP